MKQSEFLPVSRAVTGAKGGRLQISLVERHQMAFDYFQKEDGLQLYGTLDQQQLISQQKDHSITDLTSLYQLTSRPEVTRLSINNRTITITLLKEEDGLFNQEDILITLKQTKQSFSPRAQFEMAQMRKNLIQLRQEFMEYKKRNSQIEHKQKIQEDILNTYRAEIQVLKEQLQKCKVAMRAQTERSHQKHKQIRATFNLISNDSQINEIRWIVLGPSLAHTKQQKWLFQINAVTWMAVGLADKQKLKDRMFQRLNGRSNHGCHVMDCRGWIHTTKGSLYDYQQMGFGYSQGDQIYLQIDDLKKQIRFVNQNSLEVFVLPYQWSPNELFVAVALNKQCSITYKNLNKV